jgi:CRP/FNR family transcriptional regulator
MQHYFDIYHQTFKTLNPEMTEEEWAYFESGLTVREFKARDYFIEANKKNQLLGFVISGLVRGYYVNQLGEDMTTTFTKEHGFVTDYPSLLNHKPSRYNFQCLEPTTIITVTFDHIRSGYDRFTGFERNGRLIAEEILKTQQQRIESFQFDSAETRYLDFVKAHPELFNRISLTHLSSYLGIERPSLSRIRKKIVGL